MSDPIIIVDYDPLWPEQFELLRFRIAATLGALAAAIEHVGSTAVPGLAAKPIIDIDIRLYSADSLSDAIKRLASLGYLHRGDLGIPGREAFRAPLPDVPHHLYVCLPGYPEFNRHVTFRDQLRSHPDDAKAYEVLKRKLASKFRDDREAYNQAKAEFVETILAQAKALKTEHSEGSSRIMF